MQKIAIILLLGLAFLIGLGLTFVWPQYAKFKLAQEKGKLTVIARSKPPGTIADLYLAKAIEPATGKAKVLTNSFSTADNDLYLVITFTTIVPGTRVEFVRYRNDKYLDHGSLQIVKTAAQYASINWSSHPPLGNRPKGTYLIKVYTNGRLEKTTVYTVS